MNLSISNWHELFLCSKMEKLSIIDLLLQLIIITFVVIA